MQAATAQPVIGMADRKTLTAILGAVSTTEPLEASRRLKVAPAARRPEGGAPLAGWQEASPRRPSKSDGNDEEVLLKVGVASLGQGRSALTPPSAEKLREKSPSRGRDPPRRGGGDGSASRRADPTRPGPPAQRHALSGALENEAQEAVEVPSNGTTDRLSGNAPATSSGASANRQAQPQAAATDESMAVSGVDYSECQADLKARRLDDPTERDAPEEPLTPEGGTRRVLIATRRINSNQEARRTVVIDAPSAPSSSSKAGGNEDDGGRETSQRSSRSSAAIRRCKSLPATPTVTKKGRGSAKDAHSKAASALLPKSTTSTAAGAGSSAAKVRKKGCSKKMVLPFSYGTNDPRLLHVEQAEGPCCPAFLPPTAAPP